MYKKSSEPTSKMAQYIKQKITDAVSNKSHTVISCGGLGLIRPVVDRACCHSGKISYEVKPRRVSKGGTGAQ